MRNYATFKIPRDKEGYEVGNDSDGPPGVCISFHFMCYTGTTKNVDQYRLGQCLAHGQLHSEIISQCSCI